MATAIGVLKEIKSGTPDAKNPQMDFKTEVLLDLAKQLLGKAVEIREKLVADFPAKGQYAVNLGRVYSVNVTFAWNHGNEPEASLGWWNKAIDTFERTIRGDADRESGATLMSLMELGAALEAESHALAYFGRATRRWPTGIAGWICLARRSYRTISCGWPGVSPCPIRPAGRAVAAADELAAEWDRGRGLSRRYDSQKAENDCNKWVEDDPAQVLSNSAYTMSAKPARGPARNDARPAPAAKPENPAGQPFDFAANLVNV